MEAYVQQTFLPTFEERYRRKKMKGYCEHPFFYNGKYYAKVCGNMIEIPKDVARVMHNTYRSGQPKKIVRKNEKGEIVEKVNREIFYSTHSDGEIELSIETMPDPFCNVEEEALCCMEYAELYHAIGKLQDKEKILVKGIFFENKTQNEMASELGITQQAVAYRQKKVLEKLNQMLA